MKKKKIFVCLTIISVFLIRYLYHTDNPLYFWFPDSYHYLQRAEEIAAGNPLVNPFRTPLYPVILKNILDLPGGLPINSLTIASFNYHPLINFQFILGIFQAIFFLAVAYRLFGLSWQFALVAGIFAINIHTFAWEKNILPETTTAFLLAGFILFLTRFIDSANILYLPLMVITSLFLFLLRPIYFLLPISLLPFIIYYLLQKKLPATAIVVTLFFFASLLVPLYYREENRKLYNYSGFTTVSDHNLLGKVIQYKLTPANQPADGSDRILTDCVKKHLPGRRVELDECIASLGLTHDRYFVESAKIVGRFAGKTVREQPLLFTIKSIAFLPQTLISTQPDPFTWISIYSSTPALRSLWVTFNKIHQQILPLLLSFFIFYPLSIYLFIKKTDKETATIALIGTIAAYQHFFNTFFAHTDYIRLRSVTEAWVWLFCLYFFFTLLCQKAPRLTRRCSSSAVAALQLRRMEMALRRVIRRSPALPAGRLVRRRIGYGE